MRREERNEGFWPANAKATCSSRWHIFLTVLASWSFARARFSTARTTASSPRTATCVGARQLENQAFVPSFLSYRGRSFLHGFLCVFHLEEVAIRREYGQRTVVLSAHDRLLALDLHAAHGGWGCLYSSTAPIGTETAGAERGGGSWNTATPLVGTWRALAAKCKASTREGSHSAGSCHLLGRERDKLTIAFVKA